MCCVLWTIFNAAKTFLKTKLLFLFEVIFQQFVFIYTKAYTSQAEDRTVPCLRVTGHKVDLSLSEIITAFQGQKSISDVLMYMSISTIVPDMTTEWIMTVWNSLES